MCGQCLLLLLQLPQLVTPLLVPLLLTHRHHLWQQQLLPCCRQMHAPTPPLLHRPPLLPQQQ